tara:strand:- start:84 stop:1412 length:1329 start_codon:yes stop_codon:yes gene_type:complete
MAQLELPIEELQPLVMSMKRVFAPFMDAIPSIIRIPDEIERLSKTITDDVDSGQADRLDTASEKLVDPMIKGLKDFYAKQDADRETELAKIAAERESAIAEVQKLQDLGVPAEVTKQNTVNILNEKEIIEKQKEFIKEQKEVSFLESEIADEKSKGDDVDSERLLMLKDALDKQNELVQEQGKVLGDRLPRQKVPETVGARDFIPGPLMEAYDNIAETARESAGAIGSIFQPLVGLKKLFTQKEEYEEDALADKEAQDNKLGLSIVLTTFKFIALTVALGLFLKTVYDLAKKFGFISGLPEEQKRKSLGMFTEESDDAYKERLMTEEGLSAVEAGKIVRENTNEFDNPIDRLLKDSRYKDEETEIIMDKNTDFMNKRRNEMTRDRDKFLEQPTVNDSQSENEKNNIAIGNVDNSTNNKILNTPTEIKGDTAFEINVIGSDYD